ncbi:MAG: TetR family transcriptional regulator [Roseococcus sp.]
MSIREERRSAALARMADHLLREGLAGASLRALAKAAGTSDRMLLYYFADKDELLGATLAHIAAELAALLDQAGSGAGRRP